jgi:hypothetical protein
MTATRLWFHHRSKSSAISGVLSLTDEQALARLEKGEQLTPVEGEAALIAKLTAAHKLTPDELLTLIAVDTDDDLELLADDSEEVGARLDDWAPLQADDDTVAAVMLAAELALKN